MTWEMGQIVYLTSLVFSGRVEHLFVADFDTDFDFALSSSDLVGKYAMAADREALEVWVVDDIREASLI